MEPTIKSILDNDLYKFTMQQAILELFPDAEVTYRFINRGKQRFNEAFVKKLQTEVNLMKFLVLTDTEKEYLKKRCPYFKSWYLEYLKNYRYKPSQVKISLDKENNLVIEITGKWSETVLWEVPLMALISELYFEIIDYTWTMAGQEEKARSKACELTLGNCVFTDFGTRRRRNFDTQEIVVKNMLDVWGNFRSEYGFVGTSNVYLSMKYDLTPKGTQAHEWFQAMQALEGIRNSNYYGMQNWVRVYNGDLGTALPDTLGTEQFLKNFNLRFAKLFDGVRWDSGNEYWFTNKIIDHYRKLKIDPRTKTIIYSNALDCKRAINIANFCSGNIKCSFGIGTHFTNDFEDSPALNMVIKLYSVNGIPVVKISDDAGKEMGDKDALRVTKWECNGTALDSCSNVG